MKRVLTLIAQMLLVLAPVAAQETTGGEQCDGPVYTTREVSRKAVIRHKPDPGFTEEARANDVSGIVSLAAVLCHTGRVTDVRVLQGLPDGLTELAVKAARGAEFTPAEKDGRRVSTHVRFDYNFNVYGGKLDTPDAKHNKRLVEELIVEGNRRLTDEEIIRHVKTRPGDLYSAEQVQRDLQALLNLSAFDPTQTRVAIEEGPRGGIVVIFYVVERHIIRDLTFKGLEGIDEADVFKAWRERGVRVCKECPYDSSQMAAAKAVIRRLLEERGQTDATVEAYISELSSLSLTLDFVIVKGRRFD